MSSEKKGEWWDAWGEGCGNGLVGCIGKVMWSRGVTRVRLERMRLMMRMARWAWKDELGYTYVEIRVS